MFGLKEMPESRLGLVLLFYIYGISAVVSGDSSIGGHAGKWPETKSARWCCFGWHTQSVPPAKLD